MIMAPDILPLVQLMVCHMLQDTIKSREQMLTYL